MMCPNPYRRFADTPLAGLNVIVYDKGKRVDAEDRFRHWINNVRPPIPPHPAVTELADETRICRMLQVISFLDLKGIPPTPGHIFHLLTDEDRILEAMLVRAIQLKWVRADLDTSGLMIYHLTPEGEVRLKIEVV